MSFLLGQINKSDKENVRSWAFQQYWAISEWQDKKDKNKVKMKEEPAPIYVDWQQFEDKFQNHFSLFTTKEVAQHKLRIIEMGYNTCKKYTTEFNTYANLTGFNEEYLINKYKAGLSTQLRQKVISNTPLPVTLEDWIDKANTLDREFQKEKELQRLQNNKP